MLCLDLIKIWEIIRKIPKTKIYIHLACLSFFSFPAPCQFQLLSKDYGKHLLEVEDLLQKHSLQEADIAVQAERVESLNKAALKFTTIEGKESSMS